ncbi:MAG: GNAT family N-acetyltransferase [Acidimicrobiia bacterium]
MITVQALGADSWRKWRALRLEALREAPYAFSSRLADWEGTGDTQQRWRDRLQSVPFNAVAFLNGHAVGQASGTACSAKGHVELISMWVAPIARGRGVGDELVGAVIEWAQTQSARHVVLSVRHANTSAIVLYERNGFLPTGHHNDDDEIEMARPLQPSLGRG